MAQIWIFFAPGAGGDGLANLLEHCRGMDTWTGDRSHPVWRVHRVVDDQVKFWAPTIDSQHCFRSGRAFDHNQNSLDNQYMQMVLARRDLVVTSHDILLCNLDRSDRQDILCRDQIRILLDSRDYLRCHRQHMIKNLVTVDERELHDRAAAERLPLYRRYTETDRTRFDHVLWQEDLADRTGLQSLLDRLDLSIDSAILDQYQSLRSGAWREVMRGDQQPPRWQSYVEHGKIRYQSLDSGPVDQ